MCKKDLTIYRCKISTLHKDTFEVQGVWHEISINRTIPWHEQDGKWSLSPCDTYITSHRTEYDGFSQPFNASEERCDRWVYDKSVFRSTFITKVSYSFDTHLSNEAVHCVMI